DCLTKANIAEPFLPARHLGIFAGVIIQVEHQEVVFQSRSRIVKLEVARLLLGFKSCKIVSAQAADNLRVSRLKSNYLCILVGNNQEGHPIKIRKLLSLAVHLPVVRIFLQHHTLPRYKLFDPEWSQACDFVRWSIQLPRIGNLSIPVIFLQQMPWEHRKSVKEPFQRSVRRG